MRKILVAAVLFLAACAPPPPLRYQGPALKPYPFPPVHRVVILYCVICSMWYSPTYSKVFNDDTYVIGTAYGPFGEYHADEGDVMYRAVCGRCP